MEKEDLTFWQTVSLYVLWIVAYVVTVPLRLFVAFICAVVAVVAFLVYCAAVVAAWIIALYEWGKQWFASS